MLAYTPIRNEFGQVVGYKWRNKFGQEETTQAVQGSWGQVPVPPPPPRRDLNRFDRLSTVSRSRFGFADPTVPAAAAPPPAPSNTMPLAKQLYQKFSGNVQGSLSGNPTDQDYTQSDRAYNAAQRQWENVLQDRAQTSSLQANSMWALPPQGVSEADYSYWRNAPLTQLAYLTQGASGKDRFTDNANRLARGIRTTANSMQSMSADDLLANLFGANRGSALGRSFQTQQQPNFRFDDNGLFQGMKEGKWNWAPASQQAAAMQSYLGAIYGTQYSPELQQPAMDYVNRLIDQWASRSYNKRNPGSLINWLGSQMGY